MSFGLDRRIRRDLLHRLRWNVLGDLGDEAPLSRISACSHDLGTKADLDMDYDEEN
jgi:hypothetical protein